MVAAESTFEIPQEDAYLVSQRKYNLDPGRPWWERLYFKCVFLPVVRFGFKHMHVPAPSAMQPDGRIEIIEQAKLCLEEEAAERYCKARGEFWSWKPIPVDVDLPDGSVQYKAQRAPGSILPDRYRRRSFPGIALGTRTQVAELTATLETISRTATGQR